MHAKMASTKPSLTFKVTQKKQELISPAKSTPHEFKNISDIDNNVDLRSYLPMINLYQKNPNMEGRDPVSIIRDAVAKALVFYYPVAGRLREFDGGKLVVECTGEGVVFVEADADVMLHEFGDALYPPFPHLEDLLLDFPIDHGVVNSPLMIIQVTRLKCGGFIVAHRFCHVMFDGTGLHQFVSAVAELARGAAAPSTPPAWERHLLTARSPPQVSFTHHDSNISGSANGGKLDPTSLDQMVERHFFFSTADISALRRTLPPHLQSCSTFDIVAACVWRCRTIALFSGLDIEVKIMCTVDVRKQMKPPLPAGYYGNVIANPAAVTSAEKLWKNPLGYAVELVRNAKYEATEEYLRSPVNLKYVVDGVPVVTKETYVVSDLTKAGFENIDYGWGTAEYGGTARLTRDVVVSWYVSVKNNTTGEKEVLVPACLPETAMKVFAKQLQMMITSASITSAL